VSALPFAPSFGLAAVLYVLRGMFNRDTTGARSALSVSIVRPHRRGLAASMANVSMQVPRSVSPVLTGFLFAAGDLALPFFIGAAFQGAYLVLYYLSFGQIDQRNVRETLPRQLEQVQPPPPVVGGSEHPPDIQRSTPS